MIPKGATNAQYPHFYLTPRLYFQVILRFFLPIINCYFDNKWPPSPRKSICFSKRNFNIEHYFVYLGSISMENALFFWRALLEAPFFRPSFFFTLDFILPRQKLSDFCQKNWYFEKYFVYPQFCFQIFVKKIGITPRMF